MECQDDFRDDFDDIAGMEFNKAGITERITQDCDDFYRVVHDPCVGISDDGDNSGGGDGGSVDAPTPTTPEVSEPAPAEGTSGSNYNSGTLITMFLSLIGMILVMF